MKDIKVAEVETHPLFESDVEDQFALSISTIEYDRQVKLSWSQIWRLMLGKPMELRVICDRHTFGVSSAKAILRFI